MSARMGAALAVIAVGAAAAVLIPILSNLSAGVSMLVGMAIGLIAIAVSAALMVTGRPGVTDRPPPKDKTGESHDAPKSSP